MRTCVWIWGRSPEAVDFFYRMQAVCPDQVFYTETWAEILVRMKERGLTGVLYALPDEEQRRQLLRFFKALAALPAYELRMALSDTEPAWQLPLHKVEEREGVSFLCFSFRRMALWQRILKRSCDLLFGALGLAALSPLFLISAVLVKFTSRGPVFYSQERIGKNGKPFRIYKFRSMYIDAEKNVPRLSHAGDRRITAWGNIMRKYRIDELPQLYNALKGDMSIVGYRPEREYFIGRIEEVAPYYPLLFSVRPGISSLGITTFGYAENVPQMVVRLACDMDYLQRLSLREDLRIVGRTFRVVIYGIGK